MGEFFLAGMRALPALSLQAFPAAGPIPALWLRLSTSIFILCLPQAHQTQDSGKCSHIRPCQRWGLLAPSGSGPHFSSLITFPSGLSSLDRGMQFPHWSGNIRLLRDWASCRRKGPPQLQEAGLRARQAKPGIWAESCLKTLRTQ